MKVCKNCNTVNKPKVTKCSHCSMQNNFTEYIEGSAKKEPAIKKIYQSCSNCGTAEMGKGTHCSVCNFPIQKNDASENSIKNTAS